MKEVGTAQGKGGSGGNAGIKDENGDLTWNLKRRTRVAADYGHALEVRAGLWRSRRPHYVSPWRS